MKPDNQKDSAAPDSNGLHNPAIGLVRKRVDAAYAHAPPADEEAREVASLGGSAHLSRHQKFVDELMSSGKPLSEIQETWRNYYENLPDAEKHQVWQEFYAAHEQTTHLAELKHSRPLPTTHRLKAKLPARRKTRPAAKKIAAAQTKEPQRAGMSALRSLMFGLGVGMMVIVIFLFSFFNERFIAPFIQPSRNITNTPIITDSTAVGPNPEIIIPKINVEIPVVYGVDTIDDSAVENALEDGVVHYADTALPGQDGNLVIVGHSSNNIFNQGRYKFAFVLLSRLDSGDTFYLQKDGVRYTYQVYQKEIVAPSDVSVLGAKDKPATATLITCDPPGTSTNRLVVVGQQIDPDPSSNLASATSNNLATKSAIIPGNSPTLWSRLVKAVHL